MSRDHGRRLGRAEAALPTPAPAGTRTYDLSKILTLEEMFALDQALELAGRLGWEAVAPDVRAWAAAVFAEAEEMETTR